MNMGYQQTGFKSVGIWSRFKLSIRLSVLFLMAVLISLMAWAKNFASQSDEPTFRAPVVLGADQVDQLVAGLKGKRIALVVNQASVNSQGVHTIDSFLQKGLRAEKLFALEHGVRGQAQAGEEVPDSVDPVTGIPVVSLYGAQKKPTAAMLSDIDVIIYDIQDVGVRFYTYISSLGLIMEAANESGKSVIVLDRPNPNGDYVAGPVLQNGLRSFVGAYPIPIVYGLTVGELAQMIHGQNWMATQGLNLNIVQLKNYHRAVPTAPLRWPSPRLKSLSAIRMYPTLALMEPTVMNLGEGTPQPFLQIGFPKSSMGAFQYKPVKQSPNERPKHEGKICFGEKYFDLPVNQLPQFTTDVFTLMQKRFRTTGFVTDLRFLELLVGNKVVVQNLLKGQSHSQLKVIFEPELRKYLELKKAYHLYP